MSSVSPLFSQICEQVRSGVLEQRDFRSIFERFDFERIAGGLAGPAARSPEGASFQVGEFCA